MGDDRTKTKDSDSDTRFEPNNNLESRTLIEELASGNPAGNNNVPDVHKTDEENRQPASKEDEESAGDFRRPRSGTFPFIHTTGSSSEAPNTVIAVLEQLQRNYKIAEKEMEKSRSGEETQMRRRHFSKMETVDCDNYSFSSSPARDKETSSKREDPMSSLDPLPSIESAIQDKDFEKVTQTPSLPVDDIQSSSENFSLTDRTSKLERLESEDATHLPHREGHPTSDDGGKRVGKDVFVSAIELQIGQNDGRKVAYFLSTVSIILASHNKHHCNPRGNSSLTIDSNLKDNKICANDHPPCSSNNNNDVTGCSSETHVNKVFYCSPPVVRTQTDSHQSLTAQLVTMATLRVS